MDAAPKKLAVAGAIARLPAIAIRPGSVVGDAFLSRGVTTFADACRWVHQVPYGCNSSFVDVMVLFEERRGTCFTKHGVIARLAEELGLPVHKHLGFYRMNEEIVTGAGAVLEPYGLPFVPQIHCFLEWEGVRIDLTEGNDTGKNKTLDTFDFIVRVGPQSTRAELERLYVEHVQRYAQIEPRLASVSPATIGELVKACSQLQFSRCSPVVGAA